MVEAIRQRVTVQAGGRLALQSPELHDGESVEVIVMAERSPAANASDRLAALQALRSRLKLDPASAQRWVEEIRAGRAASNRPVDRP